MKGIVVIGEQIKGFQQVLTEPALQFLELLHRQFNWRRLQLLEARIEQQQRYDAGELPDFLEATQSIRESDWTVAQIPSDLMDRRVEITGPVTGKMLINALNSGASVFMADFEDSLAPTWRNIIEGQVNLQAAVRRNLTYHDDTTGKDYRLNDKTATLMVRPRGWHLSEAHVEVNGEPMSGSLFDFGLFFFHNASELLARGTGPYFYLPKLQSGLEARLWHDVFVAAEEYLSLPHGIIRATCLIETLPGCFEMNEILWELRDYSAGLNCGRWDYLFSYVKTLRNHPDRILPDRGQVTMMQPFLRAYSQLLIQTCHRRGVHGIGGMAAQIPIKGDEAANNAALEKVQADKLREVTDGHDGTWVAHPGLVSLAREIFDAHMPGSNQIGRQLDDLVVTAADLLQVPTGTRTEVGLRQNVRVGIQYLEAWLSGNGCVPIYNLMEDAATAEISRCQLWQWQRHGAQLENGQIVTPTMLQLVLHQETQRLKTDLGIERFMAGRFNEARALFEQLVTSDHLQNFLTVAAYHHICYLPD